MWQRFLFKNGKVYAEVDAAGKPVVVDGRVKIRYREEDERTYTAREDHLSPFDEARWERIKSEKAAKKSTDKARSLLAEIGAAEEGEKPARASSRRKAVSAVPTDGSVDDLVTYALAAKCIALFTDGAASGNPGPAGSGVVLIYGAHRKEFSEPLGKTTNNIAELMAVKIGLEAIRNPKLPVRVFTDSTYVHGILTQNWKAKANGELVSSIRALIRRFPDFAMNVVEGHADVEENNRADVLARGGAEKSKTLKE